MRVPPSHIYRTHSPHYCRELSTGIKKPANARIDTVVFSFPGVPYPRCDNWEGECELRAHSLLIYAPSLLVYAPSLLIYAPSLWISSAVPRLTYTR